MLDVLGLNDAAIAKLSDVAELNPRLKAKLPPDEAVAFIPMAALSSESAGIVAEEIRPYSEVAKGYTPFQDKDVLVAKITPCFENGKIGQANLSRSMGFGSTEFHVIRPFPGRADPRYLMHYLRQDYILAEGERKMTGSAGQRRVPEHFLANLAVPLPAVSEQRRIAAILDQANALRAKRRAALAQIGEMAQAVFVEMFGNDQEIEHLWAVKPLGKILSFLTSGSRGWAPYYSDEGDLFLRIQNVRRDELNLADMAHVKAPNTAEAKRTRVRPGDVLLSITADLGRTAVIPENFGAAYINQHLAIIRQNCLNPAFLSRFLSTPHGQSQIMRRNKQGVKAGLNFDDIKSIEVPLPPRKLQDVYAERCRQISRMRAGYTQGVAHLDSLFASLQHRAFRGEL